MEIRTKGIYIHTNIFYSMKLIDEQCFKLLKRLESKQYTFTELIKTIPNKSTLSNRLKFLLSANIIYQNKGNYCLSNQGLKLLNLFTQVETVIYKEKFFENFDSVPYLFRDYLFNFINTLKKEFQDKLLSAILFGSVARSKWTSNSDIDLFLLWSDETLEKPQLSQKITEIKIGFYKTNVLRNESGEKLYNPIQVLSFFRNEIKNFRTLFYDIAMDGIIIFDKERVGFNFIEQIKQKIKNLGLKRIFDCNGNFYWQHKNIQFGEIIEI